MRTPVRRLLAGSSKKAKFAKSDPLDALTDTEGTPRHPNLPIVVIHGTKDGLVPFACSEAFVAEAERVGYTDVKFVQIPNGSHLDSARWIFDAFSQDATGEEE